MEDSWAEAGSATAEDEVFWHSPMENQHCTDGKGEASRSSTSSEAYASIYFAS